MSKKILIISSSPRKGGNSDILCDQFMQGAQEAGKSAEKIYVKDKKINFCTGCGACQTNKGKCSQRDDMEEILEKMVAADVIVLATPVYFYSICAQLKVLIDRVCPRYTELTNKKAYLIATAADSSKSALDGTIAGFRGFLDCLTNVEESGIISGTSLYEFGAAKGKPIMKLAYDMGKAC
ncbi:MAG: NADPH-dependent FMN reductase [Lentisphaerae bacterium GWF2_52_8]|nr:MAG: NADPH-dependent FMN reductase [Lentisphaerae bacterium GWF2_52_8]